MTDKLLRHLLDDIFDELGDGEPPATPPVPAPDIDVDALDQRWNALPAAEVAEIIEEIDRLRLGEHALSLGHGYLDAGDLDRARHWFTVAVDYEAPDAVRALADVTTMQDLLADPETHTMVAGTEAETAPADVDSNDEADGLVQCAEQVAQQIVDDAEEEAERIVAAAQFQAMVLVIPSSLDGGRAAAIKGIESAVLSKVLTGLFPVAHGDCVPQFSQFAFNVRCLVDKFRALFTSRDMSDDPASIAEDALLRLVGQWHSFSDSMTRRIDIKWPETCDRDLFITASLCDAAGSGHEQPGSVGEWIAASQPPDLMARSLLLPRAYTRPLNPAAEPSRLVSPLWHPHGTSFRRKPREILTPGPGSRRALNKLSARPKEVDGPTLAPPTAAAG